MADERRRAARSAPSARSLLAHARETVQPVVDRESSGGRPGGRAARRPWTPSAPRATPPPARRRAGTRRAARASSPSSAVCAPSSAASRSRSVVAAPWRRALSSPRRRVRRPASASPFDAAGQRRGERDDPVVERVEHEAGSGRSPASGISAARLRAAPLSVAVAVDGERRELVARWSERRALAGDHRRSTRRASPGSGLVGAVATSSSGPLQDERSARRRSGPAAPSSRHQLVEAAEALGQLARELRRGSEHVGEDLRTPRYRSPKPACGNANRAAAASASAAARAGRRSRCSDRVAVAGGSARRGSAASARRASPPSSGGRARVVAGCASVCTASSCDAPASPGSATSRGAQRARAQDERAQARRRAGRPRRTTPPAPVRRSVYAIRTSASARGVAAPSTWRSTRSSSSPIACPGRRCAARLSRSSGCRPRSRLRHDGLVLGSGRRVGPVRRGSATSAGGGRRAGEPGVERRLGDRARRHGDPGHRRVERVSADLELHRRRGG